MPALGDEQQRLVGQVHEALADARERAAQARVVADAARDTATAAAEHANRLLARMGHSPR